MKDYYLSQKTEIYYCPNNLLLFLQVIEQWQAHQAIGVAVAVGQGTAIVLLTVEIAVVQAQVVEHGMDALRLEVGNQCCAKCGIGAYQVEHVAIDGGKLRHMGQLHLVLLRPILQTGFIGLPQFAAAVLYLVQFFELCPQEGGSDLTRKERAAGIHPAIFIHLATEKLGPIGALFPQNLGPFHKPFVVDGQ